MSDEIETRILNHQILCFMPGEIYAKIPETYDLEICDRCGKRRKCDWWEYQGDEPKTGIDLCRQCAKEVME